jgi:pyruvate/2-oxoglutarate dehydrogenase complex dihydrolipoamide dehydrogenase (E3) component
MGSLLTPDVCVVGSGAAGMAAASALAVLAVPTVLVERGEVGLHAHDAVAHAALLAAARRAHEVRGARAFGIVSSAPKSDWDGIRAHVRRAVDQLRPNATAARLTALGVQVISGQARFDDRRTVVAGEFTVRPRRFILATGARALLPEIAGLADTPHLPLHQVLTLDALPKSLLILGQGPRAVELGQAFARLGVKVTLVGTSLLHALPLEAEEVILDNCRRDGVVLADCAAVAVRQEKAGIKVELADGTTVTAGRLLVQTSMAPDVEELHLDKARVHYEAEGIRVDGRMRTSNARIYAIGSAAGHHETLAEDALVAVRSIALRTPYVRRDERVPRLVATDPAFASVGLGEEAARDAHGPIRVFRWPFHENERAQAEAATSGHIRIITDRKIRVLGVFIVGREAGELIQPWVSLVRRKAALSEVTADAPAFPALATVGRQAAMALQVENLTKPGVQRIIRFLRHFR